MMNIPARGNLAWTKGLATNSEDTSFASKVPTTTAPSGDGVHTLATGSGVAQGVQFVCFGVGNNDTTFVVRLIGWKLIDDLYVPVVLAEVAATLSTVTGVSGAAIDENSRFADTLALTAGYSTANVIVTSPTGNVVAHATANLDGYALIEWSFDMTGATSGNVIWAAY